MNKEKILNTARTLLKNTRKIYLEEYLRDFISSYEKPEGENSEEMDEETLCMMKAMEKICEDGYDISGFGLWENPFEGVFCFYDQKKHLSFDVYVGRVNECEVEAEIGYMSGGGTYRAQSIAEAMQIH